MKRLTWIGRPFLLRRYGSTALGVVSARLRNSLRSAHCANAASNSPRRHRAAALLAKSRFPRLRDSRCRPADPTSAASPGLEEKGEEKRSQ